MLAGLEVGDSLDEDVTVGERFTVSVTTGSNLREPCSDLAMTEVQRTHYNASAGAAVVGLEPWDDQGEPTWLATVTILVLEPEEGGEVVEMPSFTFDAVEIWER